MGAADTPAGAAAGRELPSLSETIRRLERQGTERVEEKEEVARGGMGRILKAHEPALDRDVAMKVILGDDGVSGKAATVTGDDEESDSLRRAVARFVVEAQVTARLDHPGVVPVHRLGLDEKGRVFFTMRLVKGRSLDAVFPLVAERKEGWTLTKAVQVFLKVCDTLAYAHSRGVVHRDVKPANVMVGAYGEVYVMDWGLAKVRGGVEMPAPVAVAAVAGNGAAAGLDGSDGALTYAGAIVGTPTYMAPETAKGEAPDARTDVYAAGAMLYELLAGTPPYAKESSEHGVAGALKAMMAGPPVPLASAAPRAPSDLVAIAEKAMARDPGLRYASAKDLGQDLQNWLEGRVVQASRHGPLVELRKWVGRNRGAAAGIAAALVVAVAGAVAYALRERASAREIAGSLERESAARAEAEANERRADGLRAATLAVSLAPKDPALALRLGLLSHERTPGRFANAALAEGLLRHREVRCLRGHDAYVENACWSPSGARIASVASDGSAIVWDAEAGVARRRLAAAPGPPYVVAFLDERRLLARTGETAFTVVDADTGAVALAFEAGAPIASAALDATRERVLVGGADGVVRTFSARDGRETARFATGTSPLVQVADAGNGLLLATSEAGRTHLWRAADGTALGAYPPAREAGDDEPAAAFASRSSLGAASPDGRFVATTGSEVALWDTADGRCVGWWRVGPAGWCRFSADGRRASLSGRGGPWVLYDLVERRVLRTSPAGFGASECSADGTLVATGPGSMEAAVYDTATGRTLATLRGHTYAVKHSAFRPDGKRLLTCSADMTVRTWDTSFSDLALAPDREIPPDRVLGMPDPTGRRAVTGRQARREGEPQPRGPCDVVDVATGRVVSTIEDERVGDLVWSPDGRRLFAAAEDGRPRAYDVETGRRLWRSDGGLFGRPLWARDSERLAVKWVHDGVSEVAVLDAGTGRVRGSVLGEVPSILDVGGWSPDGGRIAVGGDYGVVRVADVETGTIAAISGHGGMVISAKFSPDGKTLYTSAVDTSVRAWVARTGAARWVSVGFPMEARRLSVSADGRHLLLDGGYVIDAATGDLLVDLSTAKEAGWAVRSFDPAGGLWLWSLDDRLRRDFPLDLPAAAAAADPRMLQPSEEERMGLVGPADLAARERAFTERWPSGRGWKAVGDRCLAANDLDGAEDAYRRTIDLAPTNGWGELGLALVAARRLASLPAGAPRDAATSATLDLLDRARDRGYPPWDRLLREPSLAPLRALPRFLALESRRPRESAK